MASVSFEHVDQGLRRHRQWTTLSLEVGDGEFMVLVGPSGCGEPALRMLAGAREIDRG